jgi:hypothetical protein
VANSAGLCAKPFAIADCRLPILDRKSEMDKEPEYDTSVCLVIIKRMLDGRCFMPEHGASQDKEQPGWAHGQARNA